MKKNRILVTFIALILVLSCSNPAYAVNNTMKNSSQNNTAVSSSGPSEANIIAVGDQYSIALPTQYNKNYRLCYIAPSLGNYVYVHKNLDRNTDRETLQPNGYEGTVALVLADDTKAGYSCIIYRSDDNALHAGWIPTQFLKSTYPNNSTYKNRAMSTTYGYETYNFIDANWSGDYFVNTNTQYIIPDEEWNDVLSLTLNYQIYAKNGVYNCPGLREVYYNDGTGWEMVGTFVMNGNLNSVQYTINFESPVRVEAIAVIPQDLTSQGFLFNEFIDSISIAV